jgi:hypothetical protein
LKKVFLIFLLFELLLSKVLIVNSYNDKDQCGMPQLYGFLSVMYEQGFSPKDFQIYFLNARTTPKTKLIKKANNILKDLNKYDYIVTFDDAAFELIAIPASKQKKQIFFSGINIPFLQYQKKYNLNKKYFSGVYEKLYAKEVLEVFDKIKPIYKIAFFYSDGVGVMLDLLPMEMNLSLWILCLMKI